MSSELREFLTSRGIATSRTTPYNPRGNGQVERYNAIIWKSVQLALKSACLETKDWEKVLTQALHSIRSLLSTATNATPHERMFIHPRRSSSGQSLPTWLTSPGPVLLKRHSMSSKYDPAVTEVELLESNPEYSYVRTPDGREVAVSNRHLAPMPPQGIEIPSMRDGFHSPTPQLLQDPGASSPQSIQENSPPPSSAPPAPSDGQVQEENEIIVRRSRREHRRPKYLEDYIIE